MKKKLVLAMTLTMIMACTGCGKTEDTTVVMSNDANQTAVESSVEAKTEVDNNTGAADANKAVDIEYAENAMGSVLFMLNTTAELHENAWLGICPRGDYKTEVDADDVDIYYAYPSYFLGEDGEINPMNTYYEFEYNISDWGVEPGQYTLVLCDDDNEGNVVEQWDVEYVTDGDYSFIFSK